MNCMDRETLELIQETAVEARGASGKVVLMSLPGQPAHKYGIAHADGTFEEVTGAPLPRNHLLGSISEIGPFVDYLGEDASAVVWYSAAGATVIVDDSTRFDRASLKLDFTPQFKLLSKFAATPDRMQQRQFLQMLRAKLSDCLGDAGEPLLKTLRSLNFREGSTGHGTFERTRESLGRELESEVMAAVGTIPETVALNVRIYTDRALTRRRTILCDLDINPGDQTFSLEPVAGQLEQALDDELAELGTRLEGAVKVPVFFGTP